MPELTEAQKLAELLHQLKCNHNHNDDCCWAYITNPWSDPRFTTDHTYPFKQYLDSAQRILETSAYTDAINFLSAEYGPKLVEYAIRRLGL